LLPSLHTHQDSNTPVSLLLQVATSVAVSGVGDPIVRDAIKRCLDQDRPDAMGPEEFSKHIALQTGGFLVDMLEVMAILLINTGKTQEQRDAQTVLKKLLKELSDKHLEPSPTAVEVSDFVDGFLHAFHMP
jgi:hypothetical protein